MDPISVLVVDDEPGIALLCKRVLGRAGYFVTALTDPREAVDWLKQNKIDLLLVDIRMPEIDGFEATKQIKLINRNVPVIAITAYAMSGDEERIIAAGCDGYLSKPINKKRLLAKIAEFFNLS
jgi:CheY-like chemotaxis protein